MLKERLENIALATDAKMLKIVCQARVSALDGTGAGITAGMLPSLKHDGCVKNRLCDELV